MTRPFDDHPIIRSLARATLGAALRRAARQHGQNDFIIDGERRLSFTDFDAWVDDIARSLLACGVVRGDHVGLWLANSAEWSALFCACARIGAVLVPVNTRYKTHEAEYILRHADVRVLFMTRQMWNIAYYDMLCAIAPDLPGQQPGQLMLDALPLLRAVIAIDGAPMPGVLPWSAFMGRCAPLEALAAAEAQVLPADPLFICFTSGTTGNPKGAVHSHGSIKQSTKVGLAMHVEPGDRVLGHMPFYHVAGTYMALVPALTLGAALVMMSEWNTAHALHSIARHRISIFGGIPTHFHDLSEHPDLADTDTSSLKSAWIGGAAISRSRFEHYMKVLKIPKLMSTYGMTENTISTSFNAWDDPVAICCMNQAPLLSNCEVRITDPATLAKVPVGEEGEIWARGETVMSGYYKDPEATRNTITPEGWLRTGDLGRLDARGYLSVTGRLKEMFKTGGSNVAPAEVEQLLFTHPAISQAVVVSVADDRLGEVGYAYVQARQGQALTVDDVLAHCTASIADYKVPRYIDLIEEFPLTATGKIMRGALAQTARQRVAAGHIERARRSTGADR